MVFTKGQNGRYLRQIIIPEIGEPGQKKLLESSIAVYGENIAHIRTVVYYLAAVGVGSISCRVEDSQGFDELRVLIRDLNEAVILKLADDSQNDVRVILGGPQFFIKNQKLLVNSFAPSVISLRNGWKGGMKVFERQGDLQLFLSKIAEECLDWNTVSNRTHFIGEIVSTCFLSALSTLEGVKLLLNIGEKPLDFLHFDLLAMEFFRIGQADCGPMYSQIAQSNSAAGPGVYLGDRKVLIVGAGGLGSPVAYALALAGIGTIGLVDYDVVEISNLNRQFLHASSRIGMPKVTSAAITLKKLAPQLNIQGYRTLLKEENISEIIAGYDLAIDAVDHFPTRFLLNDACFGAGKPLVEAGVIRFDGTCMTIIPRETPCYRCMLPDIPAEGSVPSCSQSGILGPAPGIIGFIQAAEAIKLLSGLGNVLKGRMFFFDGLSTDFLSINLSRKATCPLCGRHPV